jgi:hypothetical protein
MMHAYRSSVIRLVYLSAVAALIATLGVIAPISTDARLFRAGGGGGGGGGGGTTLFTTTLINDGSNTSAANVPTTHVALNFQDSDTTGLTAGTWPTLKIGSTVQPYTPYGVGYWASGRIRHMGAYIKPTASTAAAASQTVTVNSGGSAQAASGRTLTDFYNQSCRIEMIGAGANFGLSGNFVAKIAANDTHTYVQKTESWGDGQAGLATALWLNAFPADGSFNATTTTPHVQLKVKVYALLMNDASNNFGGVLMMARPAQPDYNASSKAARAMTTLRYNCNGTLTNFVLDTTPRTFSFVSLGVVAPGVALWATSSTNPWYSGANGNNQFAAMITAAGTTGLSTSTLYYGQTNFNSTTQFTLSNDHSNGQNAVSGSSGTGTLQPLYVVGTFNSMYGLDANYNWVYNQGTGSIASSSVTNWRGQPATTTDLDYLIDTKLIASYDKTLRGVDYGGTIAHAPTYSYSFDVNSIGPMVQNQSAGADRPDLGYVTGWAAQYAFNWDENGLKLLRAVAYASKGSGHCFLDGTTLTPPNLAEADGGTSFTGYPASLAQTLIAAGSFSGGFTGPSWPLDSTYGFDTSAAEHAPEHSYMAWMLEARPEYWDMTYEHSTRMLLEYPEDTNRNPAVPSQFYGVFAWPPGQEMRSFGHALRAVLYAALGSPGKASDVTKLAPDGSDSAKYYSTLADNNMLYQKQLMDPALTGSLANLSSYFNSTGFWASMLGSGTSAPSLGTYNYQTPYAIIPPAIYVAATGNANGKAWLQHIADWIEHARANMGPWAMSPYYAHNAMSEIQSTPHWPPISSDTDYAQWGMHDGGTTWQNSTSPYFQQTMITPYSLHDGDVAFVNQMAPYPGGFAIASQHYFLRDTASIGGGTYNFNLAATVGGTAIVPSNSGSSGFPLMYHPITYPTDSTAGVCGNVTMRTACMNFYGMFRQLSHAGVSVTSAVLTSINNMVTADSLKDVNDARYLLAP